MSKEDLQKKQNGHIQNSVQFLLLVQQIVLQFYMRKTKLQDKHKEIIATNTNKVYQNHIIQYLNISLYCRCKSPSFLLKLKDQWRMNKLCDDKEEIEDIKFAPKHLGLILAIARADGKISIFQFNDLLSLQTSQKISNVNVSEFGINCISWNKNRFEKRPMIAVGCKDKSSFQTNNLSSLNIPNQIAINQDQQQGQCFKIFVFNKLNSLNAQDSQLLKFESQDNSHVSLMHTKTVNDVSWSQTNGRSYHLIATCGKEGARIWYTRQSPQNDNSMQIIQVVDLIKKSFNDSLEIQKISWNVMSSLVAASDNNNEIKIFKQVGMGKWENIKNIQESQDQYQQQNY